MLKIKDIQDYRKHRQEVKEALSEDNYNFC